MRGVIKAISDKVEGSGKSNSGLDGSTDSFTYTASLNIDDDFADSETELETGDESITNNGYSSSESNCCSGDSESWTLQPRPTVSREVAPWHRPLRHHGEDQFIRKMLQKGTLPKSSLNKS